MIAKDSSGNDQLSTQPTEHDTAETIYRKWQVIERGYGKYPEFLYGSKGRKLRHPKKPRVLLSLL